MAEEIIIIDGDKHIKLLLKNNTIFVISKEDVDINKYLNYLKTDDIYSFYNSGVDAISYKGYGKDKKKKKFYFGKTMFTMSFTALLLISSYMNTSFFVTPRREKEVEVPDYEITDLYNMVYSSAYLNYREKDFLFNEDFFKDLIKTVNKSNYMKGLYSTCFDNIRIEKFDSSDTEHQGSLGFYNTGRPNVINIRDYEDLDDFYKDVISHEFVHLCQETLGYNLIIESSAELISSEYYNVEANCYYDQLILIKELMEIIGSDPLWHYIFTGDFSLIESSVRPFLTDEEYKEFLSCLTFDYSDYDSSLITFAKLQDLLNILYSRIYNEDINDNKVICLIRSFDKSLCRYYFNKRYVNKDYSYYLDKDDLELHTFTLKEAIDKDLVQYYSVVRKPVDVDSAFNMINEGGYSLERNVTYNTDKVSIHKTTQKEGKLYITGDINGFRYEDADADDLFRKNIIDVDYVLIDAKKLTSSEYFNHEYPEEAIIRDFHKDTVTIKGDIVEAYLPKIVYVEPVIGSLSEKGLIKTR